MIAWLLSYICGPVVNWLVDKRVPLGLSVLVVLMLVLFVCYFCGVFLAGRVIDVLAESQRYLSQLNTIYHDVIAQFDVSEEFIADINWTQQLGPKLAALSGAAAVFMGNFLGKLMLVLIFLVFMLLGKPYFKYKVAAAFPEDRAILFTGMTTSISKQIGQYLVVKVAISGTTGVLVWLTLLLLKVEFALTWGALAFFLNFIPSIGSIIASIPPILLAIVQYYPSTPEAGSWMLVPILTAVVLLLIQMTMGNVIEPKIMGDSLNLSPVVILLSLVFFGWMWGMVGALLSVPIAAAIKIVCENIDALKPISILMGSGKSLWKETQTT
jgi:predicted PurR-regulated permease PerM